MIREIGSLRRTVESEDGTGELVVTVLSACDGCGLVVADAELHLSTAHPEPADPAWTVAIDMSETNDGR